MSASYLKCDIQTRKYYVFKLLPFLAHERTTVHCGLLNCLRGNMLLVFIVL